jgi:hypothetical protein
MACKKKPGMTRKSMDEVGKAARAAGEFVSESAKAALDSGKNLGVRGAREAVGLERKMFKGALDVFDMVHKKAGKTMEQALGDSDYVAAEAREVAKEWSRVVKVGRAELKTAIEKSFDLVEQYLDRVAKPAKSAAKKATAKKAAAKKPAAKKAVAKKAAVKKAVVKKPAAKKPVAKKKPAAGK